MKHLNLFIELTRLNKPIGYMLLFWPCAWGLTLANEFNYPLYTYSKYLIFFLLGAILMRSAGCIVNDITDKKFDKKVKRTKNRPIASGKVSVLKALVYASILCIFAFLVVINFNNLTIIFAIASMPFAFTYPLMKRFTYWPQLFLGLTFNWGIIMGWTSIIPNITTDILVLYISAIFWTLAYDTIYGAQDMSDDEIIGVKSTSIKFKDNMKLFISINYFLSSIFLIYFFRNYIGLNFLTIFLIFFYLTLIWQIINFNKNDALNCLNTFKINNYSGMILFMTILSKNI